MDLLRRYNQNPQAAKSLITKALTAATASGGPLTPQILERLITNTLVALAPEIAMITPKKVAGKYAEFNRVTALPAAGGMMGDGAITPVRQSTYVRTGRNLKVVRRKGAVTNFLQDASRDYIDVVAQEMENHLLSHVYDINTLIAYGNDNADAMQYPGLDALVTTNRVNQVQGGAIPSNLKFLDDMIDANTRRQGQRHRKAFLMSPEMLSLVSRLLTNVRMIQNQTGQGLDTIEINGGWRLQAYRNIPIIESRLCRPLITMGSVTVTGAGAGSGLGGTGTAYFRVSAVTWDGESNASAEANLAVGTYDTMKLAWTAVTGAFLYKVYYGSATGATKLILVLPAVLYDGDGTIKDNVVSVRISSLAANATITEMDDTAVGATASGGGVVPTVTASVPTAMQNDVPLYATGGVPMENVWLWDLDEIQGMGRVAYTNTDGSRFQGLATMEPLARTDDNLPFLIKSYLTMIDAFEATSAQNRGLRVA